MSFTPASPVAGAVNTGFTGPSYGFVPDVPTDVNSKQWAVVGIGGTQTGVVAHSASSPFTLTARRPKTLAVLSRPNPVTGLLPNVPNNLWEIIVRKGVTPAAGQPPAQMTIRYTTTVPAGSDTYDKPNIRAGTGFAIGILGAEAADWADTLTEGLL